MAREWLQESLAGLGTEFQVQDEDKDCQVNHPLAVSADEPAGK